MSKKRKGRTTNIVSKGTRIQLVLNASEWIQNGPAYLTKKGLRLLASRKMAAKEVWEIYGKKRYKKNPECTHVVNILSHAIFD